MSSRWRRKKYVKMTWNDAQGHKKGHIKNQSHTPVHPWWKWIPMLAPLLHIYGETEKKYLKKSCFFNLFIDFLVSEVWMFTFGTPLISKIFNISRFDKFWSVFYLWAQWHSTFSDFWKNKPEQAWEKSIFKKKKKWRILGKSVFRLLLEINSINGAREKQNF